MTITVPTTKAAALKKKIFDAEEDETLQTWVIRNADTTYLGISGKINLYSPFCSKLYANLAAGLFAKSFYSL